MAIRSRKSRLKRADIYTRESKGVEGMLKSDSEMFYNLNEEAIKDNKKDTFVDAFTEFITELADVDLSNKTKQHLYDIFIKDMNIYFKNKDYFEKEGKEDE